MVTKRDVELLEKISLHETHYKGNVSTLPLKNTISRNYTIDYWERLNPTDEVNYRVSLEYEELKKQLRLCLLDKALERELSRIEELPAHQVPPITIKESADCSKFLN